MSAPTVDEHRSICRTCQNLCAVVVTTEEGRPVDVAGDHDNPLYRGYTCSKGRAHREFYGHPERLTTSVVRHPDGTRSALTPDAAIRGIARKLSELRDEFGPRSIAAYQGSYTYLDHPANLTMIDAFMRALGSPMLFTPASIDQSGKVVAMAMHGLWMGPGLGAQEPDAVLLVGNNPLVSHAAWPGNPGNFFRDIEDRDVSLIVIDPRRTETARRAAVHLQARPGHDVPLLAAMLKIIFDEGLHDSEFLAEHVSGAADLRGAVQRFEAGSVADGAGVPVADLVRAALLFGEADRAYAVAGTGPNMSGNPTLLEYLVLCLQTVCGYWARAGDPIPNALTLAPAYAQASKAQARPPFPAYGYGEPSRVRGLGLTGNGMPTATAAEEMLLEGEGRVRALISMGGNPATAWPDQPKTIEALRSLDLLVQTDVMMGATARLAHYAIGMKLPYESPGTTFIADVFTSLAEHFGMRRSYAQYTPPIVRAPAHVVDHTEFLFKLAQRMGLQLEVYPGPGALLPGGSPVALDMDRDLDADLLFDLVHEGSRVPLREVMTHSGGAFFPDPPVTVAPRDDGWEGRLDVANTDMIADLAAATVAHEEVAGFPFRLVSRRMSHVFNSPTIALPENRPPYNRAFVHPDDLEELGVNSPGKIEIRSSRGVITAIAQADPNVLRGTVSMSHSWGGAAGTADEDAFPGVATSRLLDNQHDFDRFTGQPRMSDVPVAISPA